MPLNVLLRTDFTPDSAQKQRFVRIQDLLAKRYYTVNGPSGNRLVNVPRGGRRGTGAPGAPSSNCRGERDRHLFRIGGTQSVDAKFCRLRPLYGASLAIFAQLSTTECTEICAGCVASRPRRVSISRLPSCDNHFGNVARPPLLASAASYTSPYCPR